MLTLDNFDELENQISDSQMLAILKSQNIKSLNKIQIEAIKKGIFSHQNFLVCTPSGSGKTLIGELAILCNLLNYQGKAIYLVPYKALASEKSEDLQKLLSPHGRNVKALTGDTEEEERGIEEADLLITTYEKCDALIRHSSPYLAAVRAVVIDEVHELNAGARGARLEMLIINIFENLSFPQVICMSATIANYVEFQMWLNSLSPMRPFQLIQNENRPVKLEYGLELAPNKISRMKEIINETVPSGGQVLIFVNRRKKCISLGHTLQKFIDQFLSRQERVLCAKKKEFLIQKRSKAQALIGMLLNGVAYHNASLGPTERAAIEHLYKKRAIKVLIATTTLAAGINMPARVVIVEDFVQFRKAIDIESEDIVDSNFHLSPTGKSLIRPHTPNLLFQMLGRAGRRGFDAVGTGIILVKEKYEYEFAKSFYFHRIPPNTRRDQVEELIPKYANVMSQLNVPRILQEIVLLEINNCDSLRLWQLQAFLKKTFLNFQYTQSNKGNKTYRLDLMQYLFISKMDLAYFLKVHGSFTRLDPTSSNVEITQLKSSYIEATIHHQNAMHHCQLSTSNFLCSCRSADQFSLAKSNDNTFYQKMCPHLTFLTDWINAHPRHAAHAILTSILPLFANHEYALDYLIRERMVSKTRSADGNISNDTYRITNFGKIALWLYIYPEDLAWVKKNLEKRAFSEELIALNTLITLYLRDSYYNPGEIREISNWWINEYTVDEIMNAHPKFGAGDIFNLTNGLTRSASIFAAVAKFLGMSEKSNLFELLSLRLKHGVKMDLVEIVEMYPKCSRNRARIMHNAGFKTATDIQSATPIDIFKATNIKVTKIKELFYSREDIGHQKTLLRFVD